MAKITLTTFFFLLITFFVLTSAIPGGRTKIQNVKKNKEIQDLGKYSVDEYNRLQRGQKTGDGDLKFSQVVAAESQVVAGTKYYLKIEAVSNSGVKKVFDAEVVVQPWKQQPKQLLTFKPSPKKNH
uniref:cysteine proteinase inhibitor B-like n=1 Tax=Erigeron canadensis TaxID=72917 RepID=UPI001CB8A130|nr:cysteine proteinase inhibitor B-like [Erigeron canadensis]